MNAEALQLLQSVGTAVTYENPYTPPNFQWNQEMERVRILKPKIEKTVGRPFDIDENVQDATFLTDLSLRVPRDAGNYTGPWFGVRFSAFGNLFTAWNWGTEQFPNPVFQEVIAIVQTAGFHYVDEESLTEKCSDAKAFAGETWWRRFFEYV